MREWGVRKMRKTQNPRNILYLVLSIVIAAGIWYYVDEFNGLVRHRRSRRLIIHS